VPGVPARRRTPDARLTTPEPRPCLTPAAVTAALADLVLPRACAGCRAPGPELCAACRLALSGPPRPRPRAGVDVPVWSSATYEGPVRAAVVAYKDDGRRGLARPFGRVLARTVEAAVPTGPVVLVPAPSRAATVRRRGDDVVRRAARLAARELRRRGRAVSVRPVLRLARRVTDQSGLSERERAGNLAEAHRTRPGAARALTGGAVVLVDDVVTTGATLAEASRALAAVGQPPTAAVTVAATVLRRGDVRPPPALPVTARAD
jgi:predicted amidophosphoribosyltransferase